MTRSMLKLLLSRGFLSAAVLCSLVFFTGATFLPLRFPTPPADLGRGAVRGSGIFVPADGPTVTCEREPVFQRIEAMILTQRSVSVSV